MPIRIAKRACTPSSSPTLALNRCYPRHTIPAQLALADVAAARVDRVLSRIPRHAGAGSRSGRAHFHWNPANTFVSAIEVQLTAMQGDMS
eukprot:6172128-Pleurochrysis_carterae.AAC.3